MKSLLLEFSTTPPPPCKAVMAPPARRSLLRQVMLLKTILPDAVIIGQWDVYLASQSLYVTAQAPVLHS